MKQRSLGNTGISVSEVAFGAVEIGMQYGDHKMPSEAEANHLLMTALDRGINFFDTARMYGESESRIGRAFENCRHDAVIATKCVHLLDKNGHLPDDEDLIKKNILQSIEQSLTELKTDYIDLFMLHQANSEILENQTIAETFTELRQSGKTRAIGVSTYGAEDTKLCIDKEIWNAIQVPFNLLDQSHGRYFEEAKAKGVAILIRSVLFRGMLGGHELNLHSALSAVQDQITGYNNYLRPEYPTLPMLATKFALSYDEVASVLIGIDKMKFLEAAIEVADQNYLSISMREEMEKLAFPEPAFLNLHQWEVNGWIS
ncbi:aldo/keto reductase [Membranihabitans marinus]|uniref:aldo/keto reductase n=1 Tax=Membranihabitans marinus TaxID=1227546 RepID=UPI001F43C27F|nr:aldo/keto reductase [Membranihabitans marinus]